ncbi:MAG: hypothetical protein RTU92_10540 [Candidatus Thorarchaeota archaeon]
MSIGRTKTIISVLALGLVLSGLVSLVLIGALNGGPDFAIQDTPGRSYSSAESINVTIFLKPIDIGTVVVFPDSGVFDFGLTSLFAISLGTVSVDRKSEERSSKLRDRILDGIAMNPGIHLRELHRWLGCAMGALQYHINQLEGDGFIKSIKCGYTKHFFMPDFSQDGQVLRLTALVRNPTIQSIITECSTREMVTQAELSRTLSLDKSLISYYISHLVKSDVLNTVRVFGREKPLVVTDWAMESLSGFGLLVH